MENQNLDKKVPQSSKFPCWRVAPWKASPYVWMVIVILFIQLYATIGRAPASIEKAAPAAERAYRKHSRKDSKDAYVTVRIKSGFAVLEELYVGEKPILEFIKQNR